MKVRITFSIAALLALGCGAQAAEQAKSAGAYPQRPIRLIVPQAPGGSNDIMARYFGAKLAERIGQQVVVDNRPGAEGMIGTEMVARSLPDGYTMLMASTAFVMNPALHKLPYDPVKDFDWPTMLGQGPVLITVGASLPVKTLQDLVVLGKSKPNFLTMASAGGFMHFVSALFRSRAGFDAEIVLYKGGAPAIIDVMSGQAHVACATYVTAAPMLRSGKLKALAAGTAKRIASMPDLPTATEMGVPYEAAIWWAWGMRAGTPAAIVNRINTEIGIIQKLPETEKRFVQEGAEIVMKSPAEVRALIPADIAKWTKVAQDAKMTK